MACVLFLLYIYVTARNIVCSREILMSKTGHSVDVQILATNELNIMCGRKMDIK